MQAKADEARRWVTAEMPGGSAALFTPITVGGVRLPNRFAMSAMGTRFATEDGFVTDRHIAYYGRRARGGAGLITVEGSSIDPTGTTYLRKPRLYDDRYLPGLARLADAIRAGGAVPGIQLMHSGRHASPAARTGPALSVSGGASLVHSTGSKPITEPEIWHVAEAFGSAAARARRAGFDVLEIHAAHGYLIHDFLSPAFNRRSDEWGGGPAQRARFLVEVVKNVRSALDDGAAIVVRLSSSEFIDGGITPEDAMVSAELAAAAGADAILVSGGNNENLEWIVPPVFMPLAVYLDQARSVRARLNVPVGVVGRISTPQVAVEALQSEAADLVFMGRAILADPDIVRKIQHADVRPIRPCIACNECLAQHIRDQPILCTVNPAAGREAEESLIATPTGDPKRLAIVGGGPAGLLLGSLAARRGHAVTLLERSHRIGGKLWLAAAAPYKTREMLALGSDLAMEAEASGVALELGVEDAVARLRDLPSDLVVVASGALPDAGLDLVREPGSDLILAEDYLAGAEPAPWSSVAIIGAGDTACDAAARLAEAGVSVWLLARGNRIARGVEPVSNKVLRAYLKRLGVNVVLGVQILAVGVGRVDYEDAEGPHSLEVERVLYSRGVQPTGAALAERLRADGHEVVAIGDAYEPGNFLTSMRMAWELALTL